MQAISAATATSVSLCILLAVAAAHAQSPGSPDAGVVPDDELTLVVGTRFVKPSPDGTSAKAQFDNARIPLAEFNETDHCVDQTALEIAKEYFTTLGRMVGKAAQYYFVPDAEIRKAIATCERMHASPPKAWVDSKMQIIAFGKVVLTTEAPALEETLR